MDAFYISFHILWVLVKIALVLFVVAVIMMKPRKKRDTSYFHTKMYAHRGLHGNGVPENSMTAFKLAVEKGYGVELDVQMTKDKQLVVFHDGNLKRVCGVDVFKKEMWFAYERGSVLWYKFSIEDIQEFLEINKAGKKTDALEDLAKNAIEQKPDFSDVIEEAFGNASLESFQTAEALDAEALQGLKDYGVEIVELTADEMNACVQKVQTETWPKLYDNIGQETLEALVAALN